MACAAADPAATATGRVLVVEDEGIIAHDIGSILRSLKYDVAGFAESGVEALRMAVSERPDVVLMDIRIGGEFDGIETARYIQDRAQIPVVYITAHADDTTLKRASETGPAGYVLKPFTTGSIKAALAVAMQCDRTQRVAKSRAAAAGAGSGLGGETHDALRRSNEALVQFSRTLVHDLAEPIRSVALASELLAHGSQTSEDREQYLDWITTGCSQMQGMMTSLLDYYRISAEGVVVAVPVNTTAALQNALTNLQGAIRSAGATVELDELPDVYAQPVVVVLLFQNLIGNALKYVGKDPPKIRISARRRGDFWNFTVADNGCGFDAPEAERIFSLFARGHGPEIAGHGVGLATCRKLVEQFGGEIWAVSRIGEGSQFHFTLPAAPVSADGGRP